MSLGEGLRTVRWLVSGDVQGVGFRWFAKRRGDQLGLAGWVRNLPTGQVEMVARGSPAALAAMEEILKQGPSMSRVDRVEKNDAQHEVIDYNTLEIR